MLYAKNSIFHCEGYKVHCAWAVSRDLCIGGSPKSHVTIFWPRIAYSLYNFYGATMTIKGSLYWCISMLKRFSAAKKSPKSVPKMAVFRKFKGLHINLGQFKGLHINCGHRDPQIRLRNDLYCVEWGVKLYSLTHGTPKRHILGRNYVF